MVKGYSLEYNYAGVAEMYPLDNLRKRGYNKDYYEFGSLCIVYSKSGDLDDALFAENDQKVMKYIYPETIKQLYSKKTAEKMFPALFI
jgi:hypothetical protein